MDTKKVTNFIKVKDFMKTGGQSTPDTLDSKLLLNKDLVTLRLNLIDEELKELKKGVHEHDMTEVIDGIGDLLYVVYGMAAAFGIDADNIFNIVHESNMSKFCKTEEEAYKTVQSYQELYNTGKSSYDSPTYKLHNGKYVVYNKSTNKILKSINFFPPKFNV